MKKILFFVLAAALMLCGCQSKEASGRSAVSSPPAKAVSKAAGQSSAASEASVQPDEGTTAGSQGAKSLNVQAIAQEPELPTGCEVTSLATVLNYLGIPVDKCDIADNYLTKGDVGTVDFREAFEGDPRDESSFGCYAPVIVEAANRILTEKGSALRATEVSGQELEALFPYIDKGVPVIIWGTQDCQQGNYTETWFVDGKELRWISPEHCMVLTGYDDNNVWVADPLKGAVVSYDKSLFRQCYDTLLKQAVVIE